MPPVGRPNVFIAPAGVSVIRWGNGSAPPPPPPPPAPTLTLSADGAAVVGVAEAVTVVAANLTAPAAVTVARVSGPAATIDPVPVTPAPGELSKIAYATAAAVGTLRLQASATIGGSTVLSNQIDLTVAAAPTPPPPPAPPPPSGGSMQLTLTSAASGSLPFAAGFALRRGDIPAGQGIAVAGATAQATIKSTYPDGSARIAVVAGSYTSAAAPVTLTLSAGTASTGTALTTTDLQAALTQPVTVDAGAFGSASWSGADWASPFVAWVSGHRMSSWIYRKAIGSDAHLVAWLEVRLYAGGAVEILPWVENGYLNVAGPTNKSATYTFTMGGTQRFTAAIDLKHHQRTPLVSGAILSHWLGTDPGVALLHDSAYLQATELVPTYRARVAAGASMVTGLPSTYTPLQQGSWSYSSDSMASSGYQRPIGLLPEHDVLHLTAHSSVRAATYAAVVRNGYSAGRYGIHYRDEATNRPARFSAWPTLVFASSQGLKDTGASTTNTYTATATGGNPPLWDTAHSPSVGFLPYLLTGRWYFMEEVQFAAAANHFNVTDWARGGGRGSPSYAPLPGYTGASGICVTNVQTRSAAWWWRTLAQALCVTPDSGDPLRADFLAAAEANCSYYHQIYIAQANNPFGYVEAVEDYGPDEALAPWQQDFITAAWGYARAMNLPLSVDGQAKMAAFFAWKARSIVDRLGTPSTFPAENANRYSVAISSPGVRPDYFGGTGPWLPNVAAVYAASAAYATSPDNPLAASGAGILATEYDSISAAKGQWGVIQMAIAYAVRFGATGARDAYARMVGALNWQAMLADQFNAAHPVMSVVPAAGMPAWWQGLAVGQVVTIPSAAWPYSINIIDAWGVLALIDGTATVVSPANGGHNDSSDNGVYSADLLADLPSFVQRIAPSAVGDRTPNVEYYADGKPISRHGYTHAHCIAQRRRIMLFGAFGTYSSGGAGYATDAINFDTWTWDPEGTWADTTMGFGNGQGRDPRTGNVWTNGGRLWTQATNTWSQPETQQISGNTRSPWAWDRVANKYFALQWSDNWGYGADVITAQQFDPETGARTVITFNPSAALTQLLADKPVHAALVEDTKLNCFYFYSGQSMATGSLVNVPGRIYKITKGVGTVWDVSFLTLTGVTPGNVPGAGINGRLVYVPVLQGIFWLPSGAAQPCFVKTSDDAPA